MATHNSPDDDRTATQLSYVDLLPIVTRYYQAVGAQGYTCGYANPEPNVIGMGWIPYQARIGLAKMIEAAGITLVRGGGSKIEGEGAYFQLHLPAKDGEELLGALGRAIETAIEQAPNNQATILADTGRAVSIVMKPILQGRTPVEQLQLLSGFIANSVALSPGIKEEFRRQIAPMVKTLEALPSALPTILPAEEAVLAGLNPEDQSFFRLAKKITRYYRALKMDGSCKSGHRLYHHSTGYLHDLADIPEAAKEGLFSMFSQAGLEVTHVPGKDGAPLQYGIKYGQIDQMNAAGNLIDNAVLKLPEGPTLMTEGRTTEFDQMVADKTPVQQLQLLSGFIEGIGAFADFTGRAKEELGRKMSAMIRAAEPPGHGGG